MSDIHKIREYAFTLAGKPYTLGNNTFSNSSPIYIAPTGNVLDTMKLYKDKKSVLSVAGGMGAFGMEAALNGANNVDYFDINELQIMYDKYVKTAIEYIDYESFIKYFTLAKQETIMKRSELKNLLSSDLFYHIEGYLDEDLQDIFGLLYDYFDSIDLVTSSLFRYEYIIRTTYLKKFASMYNESEYYRLKDILKNGKCSFNYQCVSLTDLPEVYKGKKYDLIILDNILQYYKSIKGLDNAYDVNQFIHHKLSNLLTDNGVIQVNYGFIVDTDAFKEKNNIPYDKRGKTKLERMMEDYELKEAMKDSINVSLIDKYPLYYSYNFIPGVEEEYDNPENLIVTYQKRVLKK